MMNSRIILLTALYAFAFNVHAAEQEREYVYNVGTQQIGCLRLHIVDNCVIRSILILNNSGINNTDDEQHREDARKGLEAKRIAVDTELQAIRKALKEKHYNE